jgi:hypothetical protein
MTHSPPPCLPKVRLLLSKSNRLLNRNGKFLIQGFKSLVAREIETIETSHIVSFHLHAQIPFPRQQE